GLRVRAVDAIGRTVSSSVLTDAGGGFRIRVTPNTPAYTLRVTAPEGSTLPEVEAVLDLNRLPAERMIEIPRLPQITLTGFVGYAVGDERIFVDGAAVSFESLELDALDLDSAPSFRRVAVTGTVDALSGQFSVGLLPGVYRVVVTPTEPARAGVLVTEVVIDARSAGGEINGQFYKLPLRQNLFGHVLTPSWEPIPLATVRARRLASSAQNVIAGDAGRYGRSSETTVDLAGRYVLPLDVGIFDLVIQPGVGTRYAWQVVPSVTVKEGAADEERDLQITYPVPVAGFVRDAHGATVPGALVRAHLILGEGHTARSILVAETTSDLVGAYEVLLPGGL
ncbi:MAG: hypothetical protein H5U40_03595, partial [Polyangiaceae bacterium]|nr:hypothetical protein [Polyangiaceae bacterium]